MANYQQQPQEQPQSQRAADTGKLADKAQQAAEQVKNTALERVQRARGMAETGIDEKRHEAADRIRRLGNTFRSARDLDPDDELSARVFDAAADRLERVAGYVAEADYARMTRDIEGIARQRPALFFGGTFVLGLALGRLVKSALGTTSSSGGMSGGMSSEMSGGMSSGLVPRSTFSESDEEESYELSTEDLKGTP